MKFKRIVFWRHGQTDQNLEARIQGTTDNPLNETGLAQARLVAPEVASLGITKIVVSDLIRAQQTAATVAEILGITPIVDARLRERCYGLWEGMTAAEINEKWPEEFAAWRNGHQPVGMGIQTRSEVGANFVQAVQEQVAIADEGEVLLFVAHGGSIVNGIITLLGLDPETWVGIQGLDNCRWALLEERPGVHPGWKLRSYNRTTADPDELENIWR